MAGTAGIWLSIVGDLIGGGLLIGAGALIATHIEAAHIIGVVTVGIASSRFFGSLFLALYVDVEESAAIFTLAGLPSGHY